MKATESVSAWKMQRHAWMPEYELRQENIASFGEMAFNSPSEPNW